MHVEPCCHALLVDILKKADPKRKGMAIDIGVGTFSFYCELFDKLKFPAIAVEPLPCDSLRQLCRYRGIRLIEACVLDKDGPAKIYMGECDGKECTDLSSVRPDWWGASARTKEVSAISLKTLLDNVRPCAISCVKIDVEGMELCIIRQFLELNQALLPRVLMFEYGGGAINESGKGGWSCGIFGETMEALKVVRQLNFEQVIIIDSALPKAGIFDLAAMSLKPEAIFPPQSLYGNIIALRGFRCDADNIELICRMYQNDVTVLPSPPIAEGLLRRSLRRTKKIFNR